MLGNSPTQLEGAEIEGTLDDDEEEVEVEENEVDKL